LFFFEINYALWIPQQRRSLLLRRSQRSQLKLEGVLIKSVPIRFIGNQLLLIVSNDVFLFSKQGVRDRIARASSEKLWVVDRRIAESSSEEKEKEREYHCEFSVPKQIFVILGSTGMYIT
jgi:hypothetical protein